MPDGVTAAVPCDSDCATKNKAGVDALKEHGLVFLGTMHLALCLQMQGMMVGMDQKDGEHLALHNPQRTQGCA